MKDKVIRKFIPVNKYDAQGMISWLNFMADQGLILKKIGRFFAEFEMEQFEKVEYLFMAQSSKDSSTEIIEELNQQSWRFIGQIESSYTIYCIINPTEEQEKLYDKIKITSEITTKKLIWGNIISPLIPLLLFTVFLVMQNKNYVGIPWLFMSSDVVELSIVFGALFLFLLTLNLVNIYYILKFNKRNAEGVVKGGGKWRRNRSYKIAGYIMSILFIFGILGSCIFTEFKEYNMTLGESPINYSTLKLSKIEEKNLFTANHHEKDGCDISNRVSYTPTILIPKKYEISQYGHVSKTSQKDTTRILRIKNIKCRTSLLSQIIFNKEISQKENKQGIHMQNVDKKGEFQKLLFGKIKDEQYLIGYKDKKITFVNYEGEEDIKQYVDDIYKMLEAI